MCINKIAIKQGIYPYFLHRKVRQEIQSKLKIALIAHIRTQIASLSEIKDLGCK